MTTTAFDKIWKPEQNKAAQKEGWLLAVVVDEHKPINTAYLEIFALDPAKSRHQAMTHVLANARMGSRLHMDALSACSASKMSGMQKSNSRKKR